MPINDRVLLRIDDDKATKDLLYFLFRFFFFFKWLMKSKAQWKAPAIK